MQGYGSIWLSDNNIIIWKCHVFFKTQDIISMDFRKLYIYNLVIYSVCCEVDEASSKRSFKKSCSFPKCRTIYTEGIQK